MTRPTFRRAASLVVLALAAACGSHAIELDAKAPDVAFVDQYNPAGRDAYCDGSENCGPAVLAGIVKARGWSGGLQDAAVVMALAEVAGTGDNGTSGNGMIDALHWLGMQTDASPGADLDWIDGELIAGHDDIANGDYYAIPGRGAGDVHRLAPPGWLHDLRLVSRGPRKEA